MRGLIGKSTSFLLNCYIFRPEDYFAEMAKTDEHMQKVRKNLMSKKAAQARTEKVRQLREQKKIAKRVQVFFFLCYGNIVHNLFLFN